VAKVANPLMLHMPLAGMDHLPSFAFLTSPAEIERGAVYAGAALGSRSRGPRGDP
jgi:hypothetical protein